MGCAPQSLIPSKSIRRCLGPRKIWLRRYGGGSTTSRGFSTRRRNPRPPCSPPAAPADRRSRCGCRCPSRSAGCPGVRGRIAFGSGNRSGSRFAAPYMRKIGAPFGMTVPAISMSASADRLGKNWTDDWRRRISSMAPGDQLRPAAQQLEGPGVPQHGQHAVGDQVDRGIMTGDEQQHAHWSRPRSGDMGPSGPSSCTIFESMPSPGSRMNPSISPAMYCVDAAMLARPFSARALPLFGGRLRAQVDARQDRLRSSRGSGLRPPAARPGSCKSPPPAADRRTRRRRRSGSCPWPCRAGRCRCGWISGSMLGIRSGEWGGPKCRIAWRRIAIVVWRVGRDHARLRTVRLDRLGLGLGLGCRPGRQGTVRACRS